LKKVTWRVKQRISGVLAYLIKPLLRVEFITPKDVISQEVCREGQKAVVDYSMPEHGPILGTRPCCFKPVFLRMGNMCIFNDGLFIGGKVGITAFREIPPMNKVLHMLNTRANRH